jgi:hypothetical protein
MIFLAIEGVGEIKEELPPPPVVFSSLENPLRCHTSTRGEEQGALLSPATIVARRHPKVSKMGSPHRHDAVGENLIEN